MDIHDAVLVDVEGDLDLRQASGRGRDAVQVELAQTVVVFGELALALKNLDEDPWLVVGIGCEGLGLLGGNGCVARDEDGHDTAGGLDAQRQGGDI